MSRGLSRIWQPVPVRLLFRQMPSSILPTMSVSNTCDGLARFSSQYSASLGQRLVPRSAKSLTERGCFSFFAMLMIVVGVLMLRRQKDGGADCRARGPEGAGLTGVGGLAVGTLSAPLESAVAFSSTGMPMIFAIGSRCYRAELRPDDGRELCVFRQDRLVDCPGICVLGGLLGTSNCLLALHEQGGTQSHLRRGSSFCGRNLHARQECRRFRARWRARDAHDHT